MNALIINHDRVIAFCSNLARKIVIDDQIFTFLIERQITLIATLFCLLLANFLNSQ
jgi:hypothetical protein